MDLKAPCLLSKSSITKADPHLPKWHSDQLHFRIRWLLTLNCLALCHRQAVSHFPWAQEVWCVIPNSSLGPQVFSSPDIFLMSEKATYGRIWLWGRRKGSLPEQTEDSVPQILRGAESVIVVPYTIWDIDFQQAYEPGRAELTSLRLTSIDNWGSERGTSLEVMQLFM